MTWKQLLEQNNLILPCAHDALTARLIEQGGFQAYQIGGFARVASQYGYPDIDLVHFDEQIRHIIAASSLPVLVDADNGYGNIVRTVQGYEQLGASAIFIEDQAGSKKCGHMSEKKLISPDDMVKNIKLALDYRLNEDTYILARTDADCDEAIERGYQYLDAGAHGLYIEALKSVTELQKIGYEFRGQGLATTILEGGGKTPFVPPSELFKMGFSMILFPASILFQATRTIMEAVTLLRNEAPMPAFNAVDMNEFEQIVNIDFWSKTQ